MEGSTDTTSAFGIANSWALLGLVSVGEAQEVVVRVIQIGSGTGAGIADSNQSKTDTLTCPPSNRCHYRKPLVCDPDTCPAIHKKSRPLLRTKCRGYPQGQEALLYFSSPPAIVSMPRSTLGLISREKELT